MGAEARFDVFHSVLAISLSVIGPVGVVTDNLHCCIGLTLWTLRPCRVKSFDHLLRRNKISGERYSDKKTGYLPVGFTVVTIDPIVVATAEQSDAGIPLQAL